MQQTQQTASLSDQAMDDLYVAQCLAMVDMNQSAYDVTRINVACPAVPPDKMFVSVDWDRRETSITYTYAYRDGRNVVQCPPPATSVSTSSVENPVASATDASTASAAAVDVASSASTASARDVPQSDAVEDPTPAGAANPPSSLRASESNGQLHEDPSVPPQPSQQGMQAEAPTAGGTQHAAPPLQPTEASAASGSQASERAGASILTGTVKTEKQKSQNKPRISIRRHSNKISRTDQYTEWYSSWARDPIAEPQGVRRVPGMLYVHRHKHETEAKWDTQVWMFARGESGQGAVRKGLFLLQNRDTGAKGEWVRVRPGQKHPDLPGYVLHLRETGEPSWVKASTARTYRARAQADS